MAEFLTHEQRQAREKEGRQEREAFDVFTRLLKVMTSPTKYSEMLEDLERRENDLRRERNELEADKIEHQKRVEADMVAVAGMYERFDREKQKFEAKILSEPGKPDPPFRRPLAPRPSDAR